MTAAASRLAMKHVAARMACFETVTVLELLHSVTEHVAQWVETWIELDLQSVFSVMLTPLLRLSLVEIIIDMSVMSLYHHKSILRSESLLATEEIVFVRSSRVARALT